MLVYSKRKEQNEITMLSKVKPTASLAVVRLLRRMLTFTTFERADGILNRVWARERFQGLTQHESIPESITSRNKNDSKTNTDLDATL